MRAVSLLLALTLSGCAGPSPMQFPIGFFGVEKAEDARLLAGKGYNAFQSYRTSPEEVLVVAREARRRGAMLLVSPKALFTTTYTATEFLDAVWYLQDEPDVHGMDRAAMKAIEAQTLAWAPGSKTAFVVGDGRKAKNYPGVSDAIMVDWYPVPHLPLESAGDHVRMTAEAAGGRKVWAVLQAFNWRSSSVRDNPRRIGRLPTLPEVRFMSYDSVLNGAQGIWYFSYAHPDPEGGPVEQGPFMIAVVDLVAGELRAMAPVFAFGRAIPLPFEALTKGLRARAWRYRGHDYLVLVNRTKDRQWKVPEAALGPGWRPLFEGGRDTRELLKKHMDAHYLPPYRVLVLKSRLWRR